uniref:Uncharacterized protein n=1 Tax=Plectus sambesii TaxID=2011161 RepID=A0A914UPK7_9BILA
MTRMFSLLIFVVPCLTQATAEPGASGSVDLTSENRQQPSDYGHFDSSSTANNPRSLGASMDLSNSNNGPLARNAWDGSPSGAAYDHSRIQPYDYVDPNYGTAPAGDYGYGGAGAVGVNDYGSYGATGPGAGYQSGEQKIMFVYR